MNDESMNAARGEFLKIAIAATPRATRCAANALQQLLASIGAISDEQGSRFNAEEQLTTISTLSAIGEQIAQALYDRIDHEHAAAATVYAKTK
jgi:hypothetical protein